MAQTGQYWLMKSEPGAFSIRDLRKARDRATCWDGVRNYQARNYMRAMKTGDRVLFYHSNANPPAVVGVAEVVREAYPDHTAFDPKHKHHDPKSRRDSPTWAMVDIRFICEFKKPLTLDSLKGVPGLKRMELLRKGSRLSVQPVRQDEWAVIMELAGRHETHSGKTFDSRRESQRDSTPASRSSDSYTP